METMVQKLEAKAKKMMKSRTTKQLIEDFQQTTHKKGLENSTVRGWIMDELEERNPEAFEAWLDESLKDEDLWKYYKVA